MIFRPGQTPRVARRSCSAFNGSDGSSIETRLASMRCMGGCGVLKMRPPSDSKSPRPVSRRGLDYCDDVNMPVICPTGQDLFGSVGNVDRQPKQKARGRFPGAG
jgi:hypothetical protein